MLNVILIVFHIVVSIVLMILILMHSGKDAGMSSVTGFSFAAQASVMERNLTRYTIATGITFFVSSFVLGWRL